MSSSNDKFKEYFLEWIQKRDSIYTKYKKMNHYKIMSPDWPLLHIEENIRIQATCVAEAIYIAKYNTTKDYLFDPDECSNFDMVILENIQDNITDDDVLSKFIEIESIESLNASDILNILINDKIIDKSLECIITHYTSINNYNVYIEKCGNPLRLISLKNV
jgi:hypothetical protein